MVGASETLHSPVSGETQIAAAQARLEGRCGQDGRGSIVQCGSISDVWHLSALKIGNTELYTAVEGQVKNRK